MTTIMLAEWVCAPSALDRIRFIAPMLAGKRVVASFKLTEVEDKGPKGQLLRLAAALNVEGLPR